MSSPQGAASTTTQPLVPAAPPAQDNNGPAEAGTTCGISNYFVHAFCIDTVSLAQNPATTQDYSGEMVEFDDHFELVPTVVSRSSCVAVRHPSMIGVLLTCGIYAGRCRSEPGGDGGRQAEEEEEGGGGWGHFGVPPGRF